MEVGCGDECLINEKNFLFLLENIERWGAQFFVSGGVYGVRECRGLDVCRMSWDDSARNAPDLFYVSAADNGWPIL